MSHPRPWRRAHVLLAAVLVSLAAALTILPVASAAPTTTPTPTPTSAAPSPSAPTTTSTPSTTSPASSSSSSNGSCSSVTDYIPVVGSPISCLTSNATSAVGSSFLDDIVTKLAQGVEWLAEKAMSWWVTALPVSGLALDPHSGLLGDVNSKLVPLQVIGLAVSVMFFAARMAWNRKQSLTDDSEDGFKLVLRSSLAVTFVPSAIIAGGAAGDALASWLINEATNSNSGGAVKKMLALDVLTGPQGPGTGLLLLLFIVGILGMLLQLFFLAIRTAMLIVVVAGLPVAASFSGTGVGSQAYSKMISWSIAFCLFKPVGALCYYIAFKAGDAGATPDQALIGLLLMLLAGFVLPSLMRLISGGALGSMGAGASGAAGLGMAVGAGMAVASLAGGVAGGGATAGATGKSLAQRAQGSGGGEGPGKSSPPAPNPPVGPGPQGGDGGAAAAPSDNGGGKNPLTNAGLSAGAAMGAGHAIGGEADATLPSGPAPTPPPPRMQSGWGEHAMVR